MPLPILPIAGVALAGLAVVRAMRPRRPVRIDQRAEDALDDVEEGLGVSRVPAREQTSGSARFRRVIRLGGRTVEIDAALLGRFRMRRV